MLGIFMILYQLVIRFALTVLGFYILYRVVKAAVRNGIKEAREDNGRDF